MAAGGLTIRTTREVGMRTSTSNRERRAVGACTLGVALGAVLAACGGGGAGGGDAPPPSVVAVRFVGPHGAPTDAINPRFVPRNAWLELEFNTALAAATVADPAVQVRFGPYFDATTRGTFHVDGRRVLFDPTTLGPNPRPLGWDPSLEHEIRVPSGVPTGVMVRNTDGDPPVTTFSMRFTTTDTWLPDDKAPRLVATQVLPAALPTGEIDSGARFVLTFDEPMNPMALAGLVSPHAPDAADGVELRYLDVPTDGSLAEQVVPVSLAIDPTCTIVTVTPRWALGDTPRRLRLSTLQGLRDLAGNRVDPQPGGTWTTLGNGARAPTAFLGESFTSSDDRDAAATSATWYLGEVASPTVSTRTVYVRGASSANADVVTQLPGAYFVSPAPLIGLDLAGLVPPASAGRRVQLLFPGAEIGARGTVVGVGWGPDRNATFAATYPELVIELAYGAAPTLASSSVVANVRGSPVEVYRGSYAVAQAANVGDSAPAIVPETGTPAGWAPLYAYRGFVPYPTIAPTFEWDPRPEGPGGPTPSLVLDVRARAGNTWQDVRSYYEGPLAVALALPQNPRRMLTTFTGFLADPANTLAVSNPDPVVQDTSFTIASNVTVATSRFYTPAATDPAGNVYPAPRSTATTLGTSSNYDALELLSADVPTGTSVAVEYQAASALVADGTRTTADPAAPSTPWTTRVDDCDGYPYVRWRLTLRADPLTGVRPHVDAVVLPVRLRP